VIPQANRANPTQPSKSYAGVNVSPGPATPTKPYFFTSKRSTILFGSLHHFTTISLISLIPPLHSSVLGGRFFLWLHYYRTYCVSDLAVVLKFLRYLTAFGAVCTTLPSNQFLDHATLPRERPVCMRKCFSRAFHWTGLRLLHLALFGTCIRRVY